MKNKAKRARRRAETAFNRYFTEPGNSAVWWFNAWHNAALAAEGVPIELIVDDEKANQKENK